MDYKTLSVIRETPDWTLRRVEHPVSSARYTVKEPGAGADPARVAAQLREEYTFLLPLKHPHLLRPQQFDSARGRLLYEDTQGTLDQLIRQEGALAVDLVANVLKQAAEALAYLHDRKLGHGSLGAHTIFVAPNGTIRLGSFIGYRFDPQAVPPPPDPAARYQAPELLAKGIAACTPTSDLYCLGFAALEMLTGSRFEQLFAAPGSEPDGRSFNWLGWHATSRKELPPLREALPDVIGALVAIVESLTRKEEAQRGYRTGHELLRALADFGLNSNRGLPPFRSPGEASPAADAGRAPRPQPVAPPQPILPAPRPEPAPEAKLPPGRAPLTLVPGDGGKPVRFPGPAPVVVGRLKGCDYLIESPTVSQKHALIARHQDGWWVYDLRSSQGTHVNGRRVRQCPLRDGAEVRFGDVAVRVRLAEGRAEQRIQIGTPRGRFVLGRMLHEGTSGTLYQAVWVRPSGARRSVAVRVFSPDFAYNATEIRRFLRGIPIAGQLRHPNIVRLYRGGRFRRKGKASWYLAMELLSGGSVRDRVRYGPAPADAVIRCGLDILQGLKAAADRKLLHRNINPSCILFDDEGTAKLGDFALLREEVLASFQQITQAGALPGEQLYHAPEIIEARGRLTPAADVYGLAATLYEALTAQPPLSPADNLPDQIRIVLEQPVAPPNQVCPSVPAELSRVLLKALAKDAKARYQTPQEFEAALREAGRAIGMTE